MGKRIDELKARLGTVSGEVKVELARRIDAVMRNRRSSVSGCTDSKIKVWSNETLTNQAGKAWNGLEKSLQDLASRLEVTPRHTWGPAAQGWSSRAHSAFSDRNQWTGRWSELRTRRTQAHGA